MKVVIIISSLLALCSVAVMAGATSLSSTDRQEHHRILQRLLQDQAEEDESDMEDLDPNDPTLGLIGDRCGNDNPCAPGLDCLRVPIRKRCYPVTCGVEAVRYAMEQTGFDLKTYGKDLMTKADVDMNTTDMFRMFPDLGMNLFNTESDDILRMSDTIRAEENRPPVDLISESFNNCTGGAEKLSRASVGGMTPYFGTSWELGALGTYNGDMFWGQGTADPVGVGTLNNCFGFVLGYDLGLSGLIGMAFTGALSDLQQGCKQAIPIAEFPPFGLQLGFILDDIPTFLMEFTGGASASAGLPGYTTCNTRAL